MNTTFKLFTAVGVVAAFTQLTASAQSLGVYNTAGSPNPLTPSSVAANVTLSNFTYAGSFAGASTGGISYPSYGAYYTSPYPSSLAPSDPYFTFTVTPATGDAVDLTALDFSGLNFVTQNTNGDFALESSVDSYGSTLATFASSPNAGTAGTSITLGSGFSDLTGSTTFRLYVYEPTPAGAYETAGISGQSSGNGGVLDIEGSVLTPEAAPEPSSCAMLLGGLAMLAVVTIQRRRARV